MRTDRCIVRSVMPSVKSLGIALAFVVLERRYLAAGIDMARVCLDTLRYGKVLTLNDQKELVVCERGLG
jgi:hypothetical protein